MTPKEYYRGELSKLEEQYGAGHLPALYRAVESCAMWQIALPEWASVAVLNVIMDNYHRAAVHGGRGRPSPKSRYKRDYADWLCWMHVDWAFIFASMVNSRPFGPKVAGRPRRGEAALRAEALKSVKEKLRGTVAAGRTEQQIVEGWQRVHDAKSRGDDARYRGF